MDHDAAPGPLLPLRQHPAPFCWESPALRATVAEITRGGFCGIHYLGHADPGLLRQLVSIPQARISVTDMVERWRSGRVESAFDCGPGNGTVCHRPAWAASITFYEEGMPPGVEVGIFDRWPEDRRELYGVFRHSMIRLFIVNPGEHGRGVALGLKWHRAGGVWFGARPPTFDPQKT